MIWIVQRIFRDRFVLSLIAFAGFVAPATAQIRITVGSITAANTQTAPADAQALQEALRTSLALAIEKAQKDGKCQITSIDTSERFIQGRETEKMLQKKGYVKKDGLLQSKLTVSDAINGVIGFDGDGGFDYMIDVGNLVTKKSVARVKGTAKGGRIVEAADKIAQEIVEKICRKKPYRFQARYNDLKIDQTVCDVTKPFTVNGTGPTAAIRFSLTPSGETGGTFSLAGPAAGVSWSGSGNYSQTLTDTGGTLNMSGTWRITTPKGVFSDTGTIPGKLIAFSSTECGEAVD